MNLFGRTRVCMISGVFTATVILRDPGAAIWEDRVFVVKVYSKLSVNFQWTFTTNRFYPLDQLPLGLREWWETVTVVAVYVNDNFGKGNISLTSKSLSDYSINSQFTFYEVFSHRMAAVTSCENTIAPMERFHMTSQRPYWCSKTMKRRPCLCSELILSIRQLYPIWLNTSWLLIAKPLLLKLISYSIFQSF